MSMCKDTIFQSMALFAYSKCNQNERQCRYAKKSRENAGHCHNHTSPYLHDVPCGGDAVSKKHFPNDTKSFGKLIFLSLSLINPLPSRFVRLPVRCRCLAQGD
jgi:hypothetical protein